MLLVILSWIVIGLVVGALGRLAIPGPNPMSIGMTILVGLAGSFLGGVVGFFLFGPRSGLTFTLEVLGAALIVWLMFRSKTGAPTRRW